MSRTWQLRAFLLVLVVAQFGAPVTLHHPTQVWTAAYLLLYLGMLGFGTMLVRTDHQRVWPMLVLAAFFLVCGSWFAAQQDSSTATGWMLLSVGTFQLALLISLAGFIFRGRSDASGPELILAAICTYLLLGGVFGMVFSLVETLAPGSFLDRSGTDQPLVWVGLQYYSYVTITTLGYGDIIPLASWARSLATLLSVTGTLFLAVVIARLVGSYRSTGRSGRQAAADQ